MSESAGIPLGRYLLGEKLAAGGMGEVYVAIRRGVEGFEKPLALKLLLPHLVEEAHVVKMFLDEARLCARMSHPHIVQIFDLGLEESRYFLAMELVHGVSLVKLVRVLAPQGRTLPTPLILLVARALLDALNYAHTMTGPDGRPLGLIHRDVTPHNILVSVNGEVKLTDFGIAKVQAAVGQTRPGVVRGKMDYLAPEQLRYERPDLRVDLFAAGLTLFFLATGRSAYGRATTAETLQALKQEPLPDLGAERPDLPRELVDAITRATAKDPEQRFSSARAFREALPPPSLEERPEVLGALVREVCPAIVSTLDRASRTLVSMNASREAGVPEVKRPSGTLSLLDQSGTTEVVPVEGAVAPVKSMPPEEMVPWPVKGDGVAPVPPPRGTQSLEVPLPRDRRRMWGAAAALGALLVVGLGAGAWGLARWATPDKPVVVITEPPPPEPPVKDPTQPIGPSGGGEDPTGPVTPPSLGSAGGTSGPQEGPAPQPGSPQQPAGSAKPSSQVTAPPPRPQPLSVPREEPPPRPAPTVGYLTVDAVPWARIKLGGKFVGETPMARFPVPAGRLEIELRNPETGKVVRRRVQVRAGKETRVKGDLR